jgi:hypothetical protein
MTDIFEIGTVFRWVSEPHNLMTIFHIRDDIMWAIDGDQVARWDTWYTGGFYDGDFIVVKP